MNHSLFFFPKRTALTLVLFFALNMAWAQDFSLYAKKEFKSSDGFILPYRILYPENYSRDQKYPLILFLHGSGERGNDNEKQLTHGAKLFLQENIRKGFPCIVVFPQSPEGIRWGSETTGSDNKTTCDYSKPVPAPLKAVVELAKNLVQEESIDPVRLYISGLSLGGRGTFEIVYRNPNFFAAAMPICGGGDDLRYDKQIRKTAFWVFHGDQDKAVDVQCSRTMVEKIKKAKGKVKYSEYPGVGHNSWDNAFAEPELLPWLFSHKLKKVKWQKS